MDCARLDAIGLVVSDMAASLAFYRRLGLTSRPAPAPPRTWRPPCPVAREALVAAGHRGHLEPWDAVWGQRYAVVLDPDGCGVSLLADAGPDTGAAGGTGAAPAAGSGASDAV